MSRVTIHDVAAAAGVSTASVSRVLNNAPTYTHGDEMQQRVRAAAEQLGYRANAAARLLKQQRKTMVGLAVHFSEHPFANRLLVAVRDELLQYEYEPVVMEPAHMVMPQTGKTSRDTFPSTDLLLGVLSFGYGVSEEGIAYCSELSRKLPVVALMMPMESTQVDCIHCDDARGTEMLVDHLVGLGHRRIAFAMSSHSSFRSERLKLEGWEKAVRKHRLPEEALTRIDLDDFATIKDRAAAVEAALLKIKPRPTALMCSGDESALRVMTLLQKRGWQLPRDLSVTGYDGIAFSEYIWPELTTVLQPVHEIARLGVERLMHLAQHPDVPRQRLLEPSLIPRASTAPPSGP